MASSSFPRLAGTLVPVFALRRTGDLGIGDTQAVKEAIDFCAAQKLGLLQILPINETGADHSPYNAISSVALDPVYLTMEPAQVPGLTAEILRAEVPDELRRELQAGAVTYRQVKALKLDLLAHAYIEFEAVDLQHGSDAAYDFQEFVGANMSWLPGYTLFRTLLNEYSLSAIWPEWAPEHKDLILAETWLATAPEKADLVRYRQFTAYVQWIAFRQWREVRAWADRHQVRLVGDIPFGVSRYSADVWSERELFDLDWAGGAPAEPFFSGNEFLRRFGQNWGIPLYAWPVHERDDYAWWRQRVRVVTTIFHTFRIDHVLGFFRIYGFPWLPERNDHFVHLSLDEIMAQTNGRQPHFIPRDDQPEENGRLNSADAERILRIIQEAAGSSEIVAEDLGMTPPYVPLLLQKLGMPGFALPHFQTDPTTHEFLPRDQFAPLSVATWGTHDHAPLQLWYHDLTRRWHGPEGHQAWLELQRLMRFLGQDDRNPPLDMNQPLHDACLRALLEARSCWVIFTISDILNLPLQFNQPGTASSENWSTRLDRPLADYARDPVFAEKLEFLRAEVIRSGRIPVGPVEALS